MKEEAKCASFSFDEAKGAGKNVATIEFSIQTACLKKLVANTTRNDNGLPPAYGHSLVVTVQVYLHEWMSPRKRKKVDYSGQC